MSRAVGVAGRSAVRLGQVGIARFSMKRTLKAIWWGMLLGLTLLCFVVIKIFEDALFFDRITG